MKVVALKYISMPDIIPIPAFEDNYIWTLYDRKHAVVVDPGDAAPVLDWLKTNGISLSAILCTHHHHDHVDGICELREIYNVPVYGPQREGIPCRTHALKEGDTVQIPALDIVLSVLEIPGHTLGHIAYLYEGNLFCGDTLFGCGCGRLFEGTPEQLHHSLQRLAQLPDDTQVYCAHEYTEANIRFALACEPGNTRTRQRQSDARNLRAAGRPTLPSTIVLEKATNPFLRCAEAEIILTLQQRSGRAFSPNDEAAVFAALREWRNIF